MTTQSLSAFLRAGNDAGDESRDERTALAQQQSEEHLITFARHDNGDDIQREPDPHPEDDSDDEGFHHRYEGPNSWYPENPEDLYSAIGDGYDPMSEATWGYREDGQCLIYPGTINWVAGEPGHGKGWFALMIALQTMEDGESVVYIDFDHTFESIAKRLVHMGADPEVLYEHFHYVKPATSLADDESRQRFEEMLRRIGPSLVIIDTATEAAVNEGLDIIMNPNDVITFKRRLLRPIVEADAAVLVVDHTAPGPISRYPMGAKHKLAMVNGTAYVIEQVAPITPGGYGESRVWLAKDKEGAIQANSLQQHGYRTEGTIELCGILRADGESRQVAKLDVYLDMPEVAVQRPSAPAGGRYPSAKRRGSTGGVNVAAIEACLDRDPTMSGNKIYSEVKGNRRAVLAKVNELRAARITETHGGTN